MSNEFHFITWLVGIIICLLVGYVVWTAYLLYRDPIETGGILLFVVGIFAVPYAVGRTTLWVIDDD
jgi:hypothetical protein